MSDDEPLPGNWPVEPLPAGPVVWDRAALEEYLRAEVAARSPGDLPASFWGNSGAMPEPFDRPEQPKSPCADLMARNCRSPFCCTGPRSPDRYRLTGSSAWCAEYPVGGRARPLAGMAGTGTIRSVWGVCPPITFCLLSKGFYHANS